MTVIVIPSGTVECCTTSNIYMVCVLEYGGLDWSRTAIDGSHASHGAVSACGPSHNTLNGEDVKPGLNSSENAAVSYNNFNSTIHVQGT
jgi:hypothetical protein